MARVLAEWALASGTRGDPLIFKRRLTDFVGRVPTRLRQVTTNTHLRRHHTRGSQDSPEAYGQDPHAVLPHRRRRLAHQA
ncbi:hypothetical protein AERO9AM_10873 [Aeromicrobium sp. 9AM]|nr:hypothetical protein AERO9AM_10873 [Aeromicrobium sp. 9AM]